MEPRENIYDSDLINLIGSAGIGYPTVDKATAGGGRVHVDVDSINFIDEEDTKNVHISADGLPK